MKTRSLPNVRLLKITAGLSLAFRPKLSRYKTMGQRFDAIFDAACGLVAQAHRAITSRQGA